MKKSTTRVLVPIVGGILLIATGVIFLLSNFGIITLDWEMLVGPLFAIGGLVFVLLFVLNTDGWWALIPGFVLMGIGLIIFMGDKEAALVESWSGAIFLGFLGLAFFLIYITHHEQWWAIISGGALLTIAGVTLVPDDEFLSGMIFFLGLAVSFGLVYLLPKPAGRLKWALYPAGILFVIGVLMILGVTNVLNFVWPAALLIAGGYVLYRALRK
ncbi:MAG: hypothetical protein U9R53_00725 [Chloroflexota bacterium]|nr:hypothetical protein [Chloroflexota bacterium]